MAFGGPPKPGDGNNSGSTARQPRLAIIHLVNAGGRFTATSYSIWSRFYVPPHAPSCGCLSGHASRIGPFAAAACETAPQKDGCLALFGVDAARRDL